MRSASFLTGVALMLAAFSLLTVCDDPERARLERVAEVEHEQWMEWSKSVAPEVSPERRRRWQKYWVPYSELPEDVKELDRQWARRALRAADGQ